jgi:hypothetical protein
MFSFDIRTDIGDLRQRLTDIERLEVPWATKLALDDTAKGVIVAEQDEMRRVFDRPTAWTLGGLRWSPAEKNGQPAEVYFEEWAGKGSAAGFYLEPQITGGPRHHTPFEGRLIRAGKLGRNEYLVPGRKAERNAVGNLNPGQITKIISDLGGLAGIADKGPNARDRGVRRGEYYYIDRHGHGRPHGIYLKRGGLRLLVFLIVTRQPHYRSRYDFQSVAERTIQTEFVRNFRARLAQAVATSRYNGPRLKVAA